VEQTSAMFETLCENTSGVIVSNADDTNLGKIQFRKAVFFSIDGYSDYRAESIDLQPFRTVFSIKGTRFNLFIPGQYNLYNALACIALLKELGFQYEDIAGVLGEFTGLERRFDIYLDDGKRLVIDDYAHNPHKLRSFMQTIQKVRDRICYIFQPHGYAPTRMMKEEYIETFAENLRSSDHLILLPVFYAGGTVSKDISSEDLADGIRALGKSVDVIGNRELVLGRSGEWENYAVLGARDETLSGFARCIARKLAES